MRVFLAILVAFQVIGLHAQETSTPEEAEAIRQQYETLSRKIDLQPDLQELNAKVDKPTTAYAEAWEAAMEKEAPGFLEKYRSIRITPPAFTKTGYDLLSAVEKTQLIEARKNTSDNPAVKAARMKRNTALTEDIRKTAEIEYKAAQRRAILKSNPELESLLNKMGGNQ